VWWWLAAPRVTGIGLTIVKSLVEVLGVTTAFGRSVALGGLQVTAYFK
jgi:hypothetical protein